MHPYLNNLDCISLLVSAITVYFGVFYIAEKGMKEDYKSKNIIINVF